MTPRWKRVLAWLMYGEMPNAWLWYLAFALAGTLWLPVGWARTVAATTGLLIAVYHARHSVLHKSGPEL